MKKRNRFAAAALAALLLAGSAPSALALDAIPPMYQQFGYDSAEEYMEQESYYGVFDYDTLSDHYRQHLDAVRSNPTLAVEYWGYDDLEGLSIGWDGDLEECYRDTARALTNDDEYELRCQLSVQLNGAYVHFADAHPEKVNGRVMVPFRAIAEALGAEVDYNAGAITAKKNGQTLAFSLGGKQLTITDDSTGKVIKTTAVDSTPYKKKGRTYVPVRFFAEGFGLTVQWENSVQTAVLYDRAALVSDIDSKFTVLNKWIKAQPSTENARTLRTVATIGAVYTAFDTIDGDKDYKVDVKAEILANGQAVEATVTVDLRVLASYFLDDPQADDVLTAAQAALLRSALSNVKLELLCNADSGDLYLKCPAVAKILAIDETDNADLKALSNGAWLHINWADSTFGALFSENLKILKNNTFTSVGESIVASAESAVVEYELGWEYLYDDVAHKVNNLNDLLGDKKFTASGSRYTAKLDKQNDDYGKTITGSYMLNTADGSFSGTLESRSDSWNTTKTVLTFSGSVQNCKLNVTCHTKNTGILSLDITLTTTESSVEPKNAPPAGDKIVEWT
ncbi:stalk domain-containing protein [Agathobaculum sp.]|uniref:stalk domain-containing protein n=1 Tax=Agathobaculum sp. TaxID=2048138 RepID=UPI003AB891E1